MYSISTSPLPPPLQKWRTCVLLGSFPQYSLRSVSFCVCLCSLLRLQMKNRKLTKGKYLPLLGTQSLPIRGCKFLCQTGIDLPLPLLVIWFSQNCRSSLSQYSSPSPADTRQCETSPHHLTPVNVIHLASHFSTIYTAKALKLSPLIN